MLNKEIYLTVEEQLQLKEIVRNGVHNAHVESYLTRKKRETPPTAPKLDGEKEAKIIALACSEPPKGYSRWTIRLLRDKAVELQLVDEVSRMTIQRLLKKRNINLI